MVQWFYKVKRCLTPKVSTKYERGPVKTMLQLLMYSTCPYSCMTDAIMTVTLDAVGSAKY